MWRTTAAVALCTCAPLAACAEAPPPSAPERAPAAEVQLPPVAPPPSAAPKEGTEAEAAAPGEQTSATESGEQRFYGVADAGSGRLSATPSPTARDFTAVRHAVQANTSAFRRCYEQALGQDPSFKAKLRVEFTIDAQGSVSKASLLEHSNRPSFDGCVLSTVEHIAFPKPKSSKTLVVRYPLTFQTG